MTSNPTLRRRAAPPRLAHAVAALAAMVAFALGAAGPGAAGARALENPSRANAGGGGWGWDPLISTLQSLVPIAGALGLLVGLAIWGAAGPNSAQKAAGLGVMGTAALGLVIGSFATDLAAMFTQWI